MCCVEVSLARTFRSQAGAQELRGRARVFGQSTPVLLARLAPDGSSWRTSQLSLDGDCQLFSQTFPRSGMTRSGTAYRLRPLVPLTGGTGFGSLPTPSASSYGSNRSASEGARVRLSLESMARKNAWPTPRATDGDKGGRGDLLAMVRTGKDSRRKNWPTPRTSDTNGPGRHGTGGPDPRTAVTETHPNNGSLNPTWVEWLMGFPLGWTDLEASETP